MKNCCLFSFETASEAIKNSNFSIIENFGGEGEGFSWRSGNKKLCKCKMCDASFLEYEMKFLAMNYEKDDSEVNYVYYLPVENRNEAIEYIEKYLNSGAIASKDSPYKGKKIWFSSFELKWNWKNRSLY